MNKEAFRNTIFSMSDRLYPMIKRLLGNNRDSKDAIQEIMLKLWNKRAVLHEHKNVAGYVFLTAKNHCFDIIKAKNRSKMDYTDSFPKQSSGQGIENFEYQELTKLIEKILLECPIQHKEILILRDIDGLEYTEISGMTDLSVEHIRVIISRTRKFVQTQLKEHYHYG